MISCELIWISMPFLGPRSLRCNKLSKMISKTQDFASTSNIKQSTPKTQVRILTIQFSWTRFATHNPVNFCYFQMATTMSEIENKIKENKIKHFWHKRRKIQNFRFIGQSMWLEWICQSFFRAEYSPKSRERLRAKSRVLDFSQTEPWIRATVCSYEQCCICEIKRCQEHLQAQPFVGPLGPTHPFRLRNLKWVGPHSHEAHRPASYRNYESGRRRRIRSLSGSGALRFARDGRVAFRS